MIVVVPRDIETAALDKMNPSSEGQVAIESPVSNFQSIFDTVRSRKARTLYPSF